MDTTMHKLTNFLKAVGRFIRDWGIPLLLGILFYVYLLAIYADGYYDCRESLLSEPEIVNYER